MRNYGVHSFVANVSNLVLNQGAPLMIGHIGSMALVGFYTFPSRLLSYSVEAVTRIGFVTRSNVVEMQTKGDEKSIYSSACYLNRYCVTLFLPLVIFLLVYGSELLHIWVKIAEVAVHAAPLLPVIALTTMFAVAGQYNSTSMLYGLSRHDRMAQGCWWRAVGTAGHLAGVAALRVVGCCVGHGLALRSQPRDCMCRGWCAKP